ncbi:hypothetical protein TGGT1_254150 [Toxoplasma gondii GT1]|uniref:Uncharacterized protein n=3 Tax=Toxoplasma gondii TaxID=5811 RepID=S7VVH7_TOXGG|nr:hypothetical protein TGGT1_254150 [Toxoplasma gondii GT1]KAF4645319.1 hypothetical protein TGRH88_004210 [Toxoplasma gondii]KFG52986.1 hypothetical protein TGFOU_254150 [Toxoplasma gondii FOU]
MVQWRRPSVTWREIVALCCCGGRSRAVEHALGLKLISKEEQERVLHSYNPTEEDEEALSQEERQAADAVVFPFRNRPSLRYVGDVYRLDDLLERTPSSEKGGGRACSACRASLICPLEPEGGFVLRLRPIRESLSKRGKGEKEKLPHGSSCQVLSVVHESPERSERITSSSTPERENFEARGSTHAHTVRGRRERYDGASEGTWRTRERRGQPEEIRKTVSFSDFRSCDRFTRRSSPRTQRGEGMRPFGAEAGGAGFSGEDKGFIPRVSRLSWSTPRFTERSSSAGLFRAEATDRLPIEGSPSVQDLNPIRITEMVKRERKSVEHEERLKRGCDNVYAGDSSASEEDEFLFFPSHQASMTDRSASGAERLWSRQSAATGSADEATLAAATEAAKAVATSSLVRRERRAASLACATPRARSVLFTARSFLDSPRRISAGHALRRASTGSGGDVRAPGSTSQHGGEWEPIRDEATGTDGFTEAEECRQSVEAQGQKVYSCDRQKVRGHGYKRRDWVSSTGGLGEGDGEDVHPASEPTRHRIISRREVESSRRADCVREFERRESDCFAETRVSDFVDSSGGYLPSPFPPASPRRMRYSRRRDNSEGEGGHRDLPSPESGQIRSDDSGMVTARGAVTARSRSSNEEFYTPRTFRSFVCSSSTSPSPRGTDAACSRFQTSSLAEAVAEVNFLRKLRAATERIRHASHAGAGTRADETRESQGM